MFLIIDVGNSYSKIAIFSKDKKMIKYLIYKKMTLLSVKKLIDKYNITYSIMSPVGKSYKNIENYLSLKTKYIKFSNLTKLPITIDYETPETLGLDRIANAVAVADLYKNGQILSIQAGSCIVYDLVVNNIFIGGAISPGINLRFKALNKFVAKLPLAKIENITFFTGKTSYQSIESGVINGVINEINGFINIYRNQYEKLKIVLTGGNAEYLQNKIKSSIFVNSKIVLYGLLKILIFNVET